MGELAREGGTHSIWINVESMVKEFGVADHLGRPIEHLTNFLAAEGVVCSICAPQTTGIAYSLREHHSDAFVQTKTTFALRIERKGHEDKLRQRMHGLLQKYVKRHVRCNQCSGIHTSLEVSSIGHKSRTELICNKCRARRFITKCTN